MNLDELPKFLRPRLRLFLSADLVGSSALKQGSINLSDRSSADRGASAKWFYPIAEFYRIFEVEFFQEWEKYSTDPAKRPNWPAVPNRDGRCYGK
jgi:hypothetical protein